jgi:hypothetical protein
VEELRSAVTLLVSPELVDSVELDVEEELLEVLVLSVELPQETRSVPTKAAQRISAKSFLLFIFFSPFSFLGNLFFFPNPGM